jgi:hypothetical protein
MPRLQILDLLNAVSTVAPAYHDVAVWWYLPPGASEPKTESPGLAGPPAEIVVEPVGGATPDLEAIRLRLTGQLGGRPVNVRPHAGEAERFHLYRLLTRRA